MVYIVTHLHLVWLYHILHDSWTEMAVMQIQLPLRGVCWVQTSCMTGLALR